MTISEIKARLDLCNRDQSQVINIDCEYDLYGEVNDNPNTSAIPDLSVLITAMDDLNKEDADQLKQDISDTTGTHYFLGGKRIRT